MTIVETQLVNIRNLIEKHNVKDVRTNLSKYAAGYIVAVTELLNGASEAGATEYGQTIDDELRAMSTRGTFNLKHIFFGVQNFNLNSVGGLA